MTPFVCDNCGFWQRSLQAPLTCPICTDFRHTPPEDRPLRFLAADEAAREIECRWEERETGLWAFGTAPKLGIGPSGYLLEHPGGNVFWDGCGFYSDAALDFIAARGGIRFLAPSHPHTYGALWQLQKRFAPLVAVQVEDLRWTNAFNVSCPFDERLELHPGLQLMHSGGHFAGHSVLFWEERKILFAGDMLKFHFEAGALTGISTHKGFNRGIPMSHAEVRRYRALVQDLEFDTVYTSFESAPCDRDLALRLFDVQLAGAPFFGPLPIATSPAKRPVSAFHCP